MVFPSLIVQIDQGAIAQFSAWIVLLFSFVLYRFKKIIITFFVVLIAVIATKAHAFGLPSPGYGQNSQYYNNYYNYYGRPTGYAPPVYFYPQLPYQSMWPQQNYYFRSSPSPYRPVDCPFCNQQNYQQTQPFFFPNSSQFPGGGIT